MKSYDKVKNLFIFLTVYDKILCKVPKHKTRLGSEKPDMKLFNKLSIKFKLTLSCISIVLVSVAIFAVIIFARSKTVVTHLAERNVTQTIDSATQHINTVIDDINISLLSFQTKETVQSILSAKKSDNPIEEVTALEDALREIDIFQSKIVKSELYVFERDDYPEINSSQLVFSDKQLKNDSWYGVMRSAGTETKWFIRDAEQDGSALVVASKLIYDVVNQKPTAILKANIDMRNFTDYLETVTLADTGKIFLCSAHHIVNGSKSALGGQLANNNVIFNDMLKSGVEETRTIHLGGDEWMLKSCPLGEKGMFLVGAVKINEFSSAQSSITTAIFVTALLLMFFSLALILFISTMITRPIYELSDKMKNYNIMHNNSVQIASDDEMGVLFESFNAMNKTIIDLIEDVKKETKIRKVAELKALQAQITPHFLYNTLNSVAALSKRYKAKDIEQMTLALSNFFRHSLNSGAEMITLEDELEQVMSYVYIQKIRYGECFDVKLSVDESLNKYLICKLTLQPLVENCIYHAFGDIDYNGEILISAKRSGNDIIIEVSDNGEGGDLLDLEAMNRYVNKTFDLDEPIEKYGIHNISQRIKLYFGEEYGLYYYRNELGGVTVRITVKAVEKNGGKNFGGE